METICQSCGRPFSGEKDLGTNKDGTLNPEYCLSCYRKGEFTDPHKTLTVAIEENISMAVDRGIDYSLAKEMANKIFPKLKRWNKKQ